MRSRQLCVLFRSLGDAVAVADTQGQILWVSPLWCQRLGRPASVGPDPDDTSPASPHPPVAYSYPMLERCLTQNAQAANLLAFLRTSGDSYTQWEAEWGDRLTPAVVLPVDWPCGRGILHISPLEWDEQVAVAAIFHAEQVSPDGRNFFESTAPKPHTPIKDGELDREIQRLSALMSKVQFEEPPARAPGRPAASPQAADTAEAGAGPAPAAPHAADKAPEKAEKAKKADTGQRPAPAAPAAETAAAPARRLHILLAEGSDIHKLVISELLSRLGHSVDVVTDGHKTLEILKENDYDLVLMDCQMPGMDGFTTTKLMRIPGSGVRNPFIPVIGTSTLSVEQGREKSLAVGMNDYLTKPLQQQELHAVLQRWSTPLTGAMRRY